MLPSAKRWKYPDEPEQECYSRTPGEELGAVTDGVP